MSLLDLFKRLWSTEAQHYVYAVIPSESVQQTPPLEIVTLQAEKHYLRVWLSEMYLKDDRRLFREYVPVVHSVVSLLFGSKPAQELPYVAGPQNVGLGTTLGRGVQLNHRLTNLLPFRGGTVTLSAALVAYKRRDFFQGLVDVLNGITGLLNVGQLSVVLKVVGGAVDGIQNLLGAGEKDVHLVYFQGFGGSTAEGGASLRSGYTAIIRADAAQFDQKRLFIKDSQLHFGKDLASSKPLTGYDYMLIRLEAALGRDDFMQFEEFGKLLTEALRAGAKKREEGDAIIETAKIVAWSSPDLTNADRLRVALALKKQYVETLGGAPELLERAVEDPMAAFNEEVLAIDAIEAAEMSERLLRDGKLDLEQFLETVH